MILERNSATGRYNTEVKSMFKAKPGHSIWELDYSQIELRLAAKYANVEWMLQAYKDGEDLHHLTAEMIDSYAYFEDKHEGRQIGKMGNFLWCYAGGPERLRESLWAQARMDIPLDQCKEWTSAFRKRTPNFTRASLKAKRVAEQRGFVLLWNGRRRRFPNTRDARKAWNSIIQGGAGQVMMVAMNRVAQAGLASQMCNQVHDSLWVSVPEGSESDLNTISSIMEAVPTEVFNMPFVVDRKKIC